MVTSPPSPSEERLLRRLCHAERLRAREADLQPPSAEPLPLRREDAEVSAEAELRAEPLLAERAAIESRRERRPGPSERQLVLPWS